MLAEMGFEPTLCQKAVQAAEPVGRHAGEEVMLQVIVHIIRRNDDPLPEGRDGGAGIQL